MKKILFLCSVIGFICVAHSGYCVEEVKSFVEGANEAAVQQDENTTTINETKVEETKVETEETPL